MEFCVVCPGGNLVPGNYYVCIPCQQPGNNVQHAGDREHATNTAMALPALQKIRLGTSLPELPSRKETLTNTKAPTSRIYGYQQVPLLQATTISSSERSTTHV